MILKNQTLIDTKKKAKKEKKNIEIRLLHCTFWLMVGTQCDAWLQKLDSLFTYCKFLSTLCDEGKYQELNLGCDLVIRSHLINFSTPRIWHLIHIILRKQQLEISNPGECWAEELSCYIKKVSVAFYDSLKWAQWSVKNVNFCSHGSLLCPISLRDWHAHISKYGPS